jgi:hypothetical protein
VAARSWVCCAGDNSELSTIEGLNGGHGPGQAARREWREHLCTRVYRVSWDARARVAERHSRLDGRRHPVSRSWASAEADGRQLASGTALILDPAGVGGERPQRNRAPDRGWARARRRTPPSPSLRSCCSRSSVERASADRGRVDCLCPPVALKASCQKASARCRGGTAPQLPGRRATIWLNPLRMPRRTATGPERRHA